MKSGVLLLHYLSLSLSLSLSLHIYIYLFLGVGGIHLLGAWAVGVVPRPPPQEQHHPRRLVAPGLAPGLAPSLAPGLAREGEAAHRVDFEPARIVHPKTAP